MMSVWATMKSECGEWLKKLKSLNFIVLHSHAHTHTNTHQYMLFWNSYRCVHMYKYIQTREEELAGQETNPADRSSRVVWRGGWTSFWFLICPTVWWRDSKDFVIKPPSVNLSTALLLFPSGRPWCQRSSLAEEGGSRRRRGYRGKRMARKYSPFALSFIGGRGGMREWERKRGVRKRERER